MHIHRWIFYTPWQTWHRRYNSVRCLLPCQQPSDCRETPRSTKHRKNKTKWHPNSNQRYTTPHTYTYIFTDSLNNIYLIHNHIRHPSSQHNHPNKLCIAAIVNHITWSTHKITIQKVKAHTCITCNEMADQLANSGALLDKPAGTPRIHTAHTTP